MRLGEREVPVAAVAVDASYEGDLLAAAGSPVRGRPGIARPARRDVGRPPAGLPAGAAQLLRRRSIRSQRTARSCPTSASRSSTSAAGRPSGSARGTAPCRRMRTASASPTARTTGCRSIRRRATTTRFELLRRYLEASAAAAGDLLGLVPDLLPNGKCDVNSIGPFSLNLLDGSNRAYPDGDGQTRAVVRERHLRYTQASPPLPRTRSRPAPSATAGGFVRRRVRRHGRLAAPALRARRRAGWSASTCSPSTTCSAARPQEDVVALGSYNIDIREVERTWRYLPEFHRAPAVFNEGYLSVAVPPYPIPYRSLDAAARGRGGPARAALPLGVARRLRVGADGADADAARPRGGARPRRRRRAARSPCRTSTSASCRGSREREARCSRCERDRVHDGELRRPRDRLGDARLGSRRPRDERRVPPARDVRRALRRAARATSRARLRRDRPLGRAPQPDWATDEHVAAARERSRHGITSPRTAHGSGREHRARVRARARARHEGDRRRLLGRRARSRAGAAPSTASCSRSRTTRSGRPPRCSPRSRRATGRWPRPSTPAGGRRRVTTRRARSRSSARTSRTST